MAILSARGLSFCYPEGGSPVLREIEFEIGEGEFVLLCGGSGGGKTTLLRQWKLPPNGKREGEVRYRDLPMDAWDQTVQAAEIGYLFQSPEHQIVTDRVWHELAFGLENLALPREVIRQRVAEVAQYFGMQHWYEKKTSELSGGQKQLLNLASLLAMQPKVLLLDEPTAQLDPIARQQFLSQLERINRDLGITILMSEHNLEQSLELCDRVLVLEEGRLRFDGDPRELGRAAAALLPTPARVQNAVAPEEESPISIREGRRWLDRHAKQTEISVAEERPGRLAALRAKNVWFGYEKEEVLKEFTVAVPQGCIYALAGGNGSGKSTAIHLLGGIDRPWQGKVEAQGRMVTLLQDPQTLFLRETVSEELEGDLGEDWADYGRRHPYDLSAGEQQRLALEKVLRQKPDILLLDEPTKGLDEAAWQRLGQRLLALKEQGMTILLASHNLEFCARYADLCGLLFRGAVVSENTPHAFFAESAHYTTAANRMARHIDPHVILWEEAASLCR